MWFWFSGIALHTNASTWISFVILGCIIRDRPTDTGLDRMKIHMTAPSHQPKWTTLNVLPEHLAPNVTNRQWFLFPHV